MKNVSRVAAIAALMSAVWMFEARTHVHAQNGPPADRPGQGDLNRADPCELSPDTQGEANGIERRCGLGGSAGIAKGDFNGDGIADLAVGVPDETRQTTRFDENCFCIFVTDHPGAGAVNVIYGSDTGLTSTGNQTLDRGFFNNSDNTHLGQALAAGNFRGGTVSDLAVAVPGAKNASGSVVGAIDVFNSSSGKLVANGSYSILVDQFVGGPDGILNNLRVRMPSKPSMTWGDFNGDGFGDLAVETRNGSDSTGRSTVLVLYGSSTRLSTSNFTLLAVDDILSPNNSASGQFDCGTSFGPFCYTSRGRIVLSSADLDGDGRSELLIGAPNAIQIRTDGSSVVSGLPGVVAVGKGRADGISRFFFWSVLRPVSGVDRAGGFGSALAVGDFDQDGAKDVAVGSPNNTSTSLVPSNAGIVRVFSAVNPAQSQQFEASTTSSTFTQNTSGVETAEANDHFGAALAAKDFNGDGASDLAVGVPGESTGSATGNGEFHVIYGLAGVGLSTASSTGHPAAQTFICGGISGAACGATLTAWNFGKSAEADLAVGVPFDNLQFIDSAGRLQVISGAGTVRVGYGTSSAGITNLGAQIWSQKHDTSCTHCTGDTARAGNHFGAALY